MGYVNKYKGFIIPEKGVVSPSPNPTIDTISLENPMLKATIKTGVSVEDFVNYTKEEYNNFVREAKSLIDDFTDDYDKKEEEKRNRRYNK